MSSVSAVSNSSLTYAQILANAQKAAQSAASPQGTASASPGAATNITLSAEAQAALASIERDFATVTSDARTNLDALLAAQNLTSPMADGELVADLSKVDRRELYAISTNAGQAFTADEQKAAQIELQNRFDAAMAAPTAVSRVTGTIKNLYEAALAYFDKMTPEEMASADYAQQRALLVEMKTRLDADPGTLPSSESDPVNQYLERLAEADSGEELRDIVDVASDARTTLDAQYSSGGTRPNYKDFDSRSIASVALNSNGEFSAEEVRLARSEMRSRAGAAVLAGLQQADSADPAAFAQNIISLYGAMSSEERAAAGWTDKLYAAAVSSYATASKLGSMFGDATGSGSTFGESDTSSTSSNPMSIFSYM